ncbi:hypothetical protein PR048_015736 [Dryococelus australis]|uniref:Uncharacterized protein n=1 Tax=Dryococelus australis TaxID=614101 RepID=A0ABQ9HIA9_9NEOP|nr:hypothetical protein PR048_015736 [Dryococelus australis]
MKDGKQSDSCGGQNRNIKITLMAKAITFIPNDSEFSDIERALKHHQQLYTAENYISVMEKCTKKNRFFVTRIKKEDFVSISGTEKFIVNRKKDVPFCTFLQQSFTEEAQEINLEKTYTSRRMWPEVDTFVKKLVPLWPEGKPISSAKKADIDSILHLIPTGAKEFHARLIADNANDDDIDGFNGNLDFDIETE